MVSSFKDYNKKYLQKIQELERLANSYVLIGFQEGTLTKNQTKGNRKKKGGISQAQIAAQNEFGYKHIPARPFLRPSFDENRQKIINLVSSQYDQILAGNTSIKKALDLIGVLGVGLVQQKIRSIHFPPNAPSTIKAKGSSKPLIDFGQMIQSVKHKSVVAT